MNVTGPTGGANQPGEDDYRRLSAFRVALRRFLAFSEDAARKVGLTPRQHQALLSLRGLPAGQKPTIGALAERMLIRPHSALELAGRLEAAGLVARTADPEDGRNVLLSLTRSGEAALAALSKDHLMEIRQSAPHLIDILRGIAQTDDPD